MKVSKQWLEIKIKELNDRLLANQKETPHENERQKRNRDYYVNKLIELEENQLETINV